MKFKGAFFVFSTAFLLGCGQNAFLEKAGIKAISGVAKDNDDSLSILIASKDLDLGMIKQNKMIKVPVVIKNIGDDAIEKIIIESDDKEIKVLEVKEGQLETGESYVAYIELTEDDLGDFDKKIKINYQARSSDQTKEVSISGITTSDQSIIGSQLKTNREKDQNVDLGIIPNGSSSSREIILKNSGLTTALVTNIELASGYHFKLDQEAVDSCIGQVINYCSLTSEYKPAGLGRHSDEIVISYIDTDNVEKIKIINLRGESINKDECVAVKNIAHLSLSKSDLSKDEGTVELPYMVQTPNTNITLVDLYGEEHNREVKATEGQSIFYVRDAQVVAIFDLEAKRSEGEVIASDLHANMSKSYHIRESLSTRMTEMLCFENSLVCSGKRFNPGNFLKHANLNYDLDGSSFVTTLFNEATEKFLGGNSLLLLEKTFDVEVLYPTKKDVLFEKFESDKLAKVIFADDIKLEDAPQLNVTYKKIIDANNKCE